MVSNEDTLVKLKEDETPNPVIEDVKINPIEMALESIEGATPDASKELFTATRGDVVLKTDIVSPEDILISSLAFADRHLIECGIDPLYEDFVDNVLFLRVSLDRKSRKEFVDVNTRNMSNFQIPGEFNKIEESRK